MTPGNTDDSPSAPDRGPAFLVVDDDPMVRKIVARGLAELNPSEVLEVEDGLAAQEVLRAHRFDVVVTDVVMPNMDGLELLQWAQENCPEPLWIILSGLETFDAAVDALHLGAFDYLAKPPEIQRLRVAVRNALEQIELVRERERLYRELERRNEQLAEKVEQLQKVCWVLEDQAAVIQADLNRAEIIQRALLPQEPPDLDGWCIETLYRPGSSVGGDFYDVNVLDRDHLGLVIADAAGHGVAAAMVSVLFKMRVHPVGRRGELLLPHQVLERLNATLYETLATPGTFITAAYILVELRTGRAQFAAAGHPPCIWTTSGGAPRFLEKTGPALGLVADASYEVKEIRIGAGDRLLLYTDGVQEGGPESPTRETMAAALKESTDRADLLRQFCQAARKDFAGDRDDITMLLLERSAQCSSYDHAPTREERQESTPAPSPPCLQYGTEDNRAFISISGAATWLCSQCLLETATSLLAKHGNLTVDLATCDNLDSTCLGTLHEIVTSHPDAVALQRVPAGILALFEELSMESVLARIGPDSRPLPSTMTRLQEREIGHDQQAARILSAHETLASLSEDNRELFRDVVDSLRTDLKAGD